MNNNSLNHVLKPIEKLSKSRLMLFLVLVVDVLLVAWILFLPQYNPIPSNRASRTFKGQVSTTGCTVAPKDLNGQSLIFDDEFGCDTMLNPRIWQTDWFGENGSMNNVQTSSSNVSLLGGRLNLRLSSSTSGALVTTAPNGPSDPGFKFTFGTVVWRAKIPYEGTRVVNWPALWMAHIRSDLDSG